MSGKIIITKTPKGFFRFSLKASNHQTVLTSQNYSTLRTCKDGIDAIKKNALAHIEDLTLKEVKKMKFPKYEVYIDKAGLYRYRLLAANGQNIAIVEEGYTTKSGCLNGINAVSRAAVDAAVDESALEN